MIEGWLHEADMGTGMIDTCNDLQGSGNNINATPLIIRGADGPLNASMLKDDDVMPNNRFGYGH